MIIFTIITITMIIFTIITITITMITITMIPTTIIPIAIFQIIMISVKIKNQNQVGILVNNVGILGPGMLPFLELDLAIVKVTQSKFSINLSLIAIAKDMVTVNITAATYLCHQVSWW